MALIVTVSRGTFRGTFLVVPQVRKGDMLCCHHPLIHIDEAVFGPDATEFKPKRFIGNPGLKDEVSFFPALLWEMMILSGKHVCR